MSGEQLGNEEAAQIIKAAARAGDLTFTRHAEDEMVEDGLMLGDCLNVLKGGWVEFSEWKNGDWRYRMTTNRITCVVEIDDEEEPTELLVVTAWRAK